MIGSIAAAVVIVAVLIFKFRRREHPQDQIIEPIEYEGGQNSDGSTGYGGGAYPTETMAFNPRHMVSLTQKALIEFRRRGLESTRTTSVMYNQAIEDDPASSNSHNTPSNFGQNNVAFTGAPSEDRVATLQDELYLLRQEITQLRTVTEGYDLPPNYGSE